MKPGPKPVLSKVCPVCGIEKLRSDFYKKLDTISHKCKPCSLEDSRKRSPAYFGKYSHYQNQWRKTKYDTDADYREKIAQQKKAGYERRKESINAARRYRWETDPNNPARLYFRSKYVATATPKWVDKSALLAIYGDCPSGCEVDHIIPLKGLIDGRRVCGLHVPWNLQYLSITENRKKKNRISEKTLPTEVVKR